MYMAQPKRIIFQVGFHTGPLYCVATYCNTAACYFALCLACVGFYPIPPAVNAWLISNTAPQTKRAMAIGYFVGLGNIGGIFGSFIYRDSEAPRYPSVGVPNLSFFGAADFDHVGRVMQRPSL